MWLLLLSDSASAAAVIGLLVAVFGTNGIVVLWMQGRNAKLAAEERVVRDLQRRLDDLQRRLDKAEAERDAQRQAKHDALGRLNTVQLQLVNCEHDLEDCERRIPKPQP